MSSTVARLADDGRFPVILSAAARRIRSPEPGGTGSSLRPRAGALGLAQPSVGGTVHELYGEGDEFAEHDGDQPVRTETEAFLLHVLEDLDRELPQVGADHARALGERARAFLAPTGLDERNRWAGADNGHGCRCVNYSRE